MLCFQSSCTRIAWPCSWLRNWKEKQSRQRNPSLVGCKTNDTEIVTEERSFPFWLQGSAGVRVTNSSPLNAHLLTLNLIAFAKNAVFCAGDSFM